MNYALRDYQQETLDKLYQHWTSRPDCNPLCVLPTGAGKSVVIAELARLLFDTWPEDHPRTVVLVPSKELAEQNAEKLRSLLPTHLSVGFYSASLGRKNAHADVIVATIGSIYKDAHLIGNIRCVVIDEAHLVNPDGEEAGRFRKFLTELDRYNSFRTVGFTATPFRGNGVWLTEGDAPLFGGVAHTAKVQDLIDLHYLSPLVRPVDVISTRIDVSGISTSNGDYSIGELSERVSGYLSGAADDACEIAKERKKWIAFCATVSNAASFRDHLLARGISTAVVTGDTPKQARADLIAKFRSGELRCLVTVLALATGFDVPDVDCILWLRPTKSPVLYVQGAGRGMRIAEGKTDCLWMDFSDTTDRLGPVDAIKGRSKRPPTAGAGAPVATCPECGEQVRPASLLFCPSCGALMREPKADRAVEVSSAAIMQSQVAPSIVEYDITRVTYDRHVKAGKADSMAVRYWSGPRLVITEWVCLDHGGFAAEKARLWVARRKNHLGDPTTTHDALQWSAGFDVPKSITVNTKGDFPTIVSYKFEEREAA
jgi:DNA repair protein RadD